MEGVPPKPIIVRACCIYSSDNLLIVYLLLPQLSFWFNLRSHALDNTIYPSLYNYRAQEYNLVQGLYSGSVPPVVPKTESLSSKHSRIRSTSRTGSFSNNSSMYRLKGFRPFTERCVSFLLEALPKNLMINAYTPGVFKG